MELANLHRCRNLIVLALTGVLLVSTRADARTEVSSYKSTAVPQAVQSSSSSDPVLKYAAHSRGNIRLAIANKGTLGTFGEPTLDPFTGEIIPSCEYPRNSDIVYLWVAAFWIGAVVDRDTLVSCGSEDFYNTSEFWPESPELGGGFTYGSIDPASKYYSPGVEAYSEEDILCEYTDTLTDPNFVGRDPVDDHGHRPLGVKISQRSMAWSYDYADDFILFNSNIQNIGHSRLKSVYIGIWIDGDAFHVTRNNADGWNDDIVGFLYSYPAPEGGTCIDTVRIAYHGDNDGDPVPEGSPTEWDYRSPRSAVGARVIRTPGETLNYSFNWWITNYSDASLDFGPRHQGTALDPFRDLGPRLGTPEGDHARYYLLSHPEFDYDLLKTAVDKSLDGWLPPPPLAAEYARGFDCRYLLSFGPFNIEPGQSLPVTFAWVGGENVHRNPTDFAELFDAEQPDAYYNSLDFSSLALNARWASWIYDNPGVDTDGDGYRGKSRVCDSTFMWYEGDNVPDFRGAGPPPAPLIRVIPSQGSLTIRWNGFYSETTPDVFTGIADFEGYRVYSALDERSESFSVAASYDREDYRRLVWRETNGAGSWKPDEMPYSPDQLREMYGDPDFDPNSYPRSRPLRFNGEFHYFEAQDYNESDLTNPTGIRKVYPEAVNPGADSSLWQPQDLTFEWDKPLPRYYEYEYTFPDLLPTIPYYVAVTAFDFGSPNSGLRSLETKPLNNCIAELPMPPVDSVEARNLDVIVYPNPYRVDADYAERGYENRTLDKSVDRTRRIHFVNLPRVCKITILTPDGDVVREIDHNHPEGGPLSMHDSWDLITRNSQTVVSGLYYWVVESSERTQMGKLVVIK
jgi:hypothetical protein